MDSLKNQSPARVAAVYGLAVVGFLALVSVGISLAIYSARFVPGVVGGLGSAAVSLSQIFVSDAKPSLLVIPFPDEDLSPVSTTTATTTEVISPKPVVTPVKTTAGSKTSAVIPIGTTTSMTRSFSGQPDLVVTISGIGYLASSTAESFVATSTVPNGLRPAVKFAIKNVGTNVAGMWRFSASIPTSSQYLYRSPSQQPLSPGDSIEYTLGFDQAIPGSNKMISITANFDHAVTESNFDNNSANANVTIIGS